ncbi:MAG TPA: hypothetical protein VFF14_04940 [Candidatus Deferrimicrobium sp.]|nr:hypothetical protein [Candidatus Deferrimicrobium sp.]
MLQANELGFDIRERGGILYEQVPPGQFFYIKVNEGDRVTLKKSGRMVIVQKVKYESAGFIGTIVGFEPAGLDVEFEGVRLGDEIYFLDNHIFTCGHR